MGDFRRNRRYATRRPHGSGDWLLIYTVAGAGHLSTSRGMAPTKTGEVILYAPDDPQDYSTDRPTGFWHLLWVHFNAKPSWHDLLRWPRGSHGVRSLQLETGEMRDYFVAAMQRMLAMSRRQGPNAIDLAFNALEEALIWAQAATFSGPWSKLDLRVRKSMDYLATNLKEPFRMETLARHCHTSVSRLAHLFKEETGTSPQQFFEQQRMRQASRLLRASSLGIGEIAAEVGYDDPFYFSNRFRRHAGKSPSEFRNSTIRR